VVLQLLRQLGIDEHGQALVLANMEPLARRRADREAIVERILSLVARPSVEEDAEPFTSDDDGRSLSGLLSEFGPEGAARVTADLLQRASLSLEAGTRTPEEIVERLLSKASRADPTDQVRAAAEFIVQLNDLAGPPSSALPALAELLRQHNLDPTPLQELSQALELLDTGPKSNVPSPKSDLGLGTWDPSASSGQALELDVQVDLSLGRGLRYYTGLVFEIYQDGPDGALQLCGGGRYDDLVRALGGRESVPACGFSFGLERLDLALGERSDDGCARGADLLLAPLEQADMADAVQLSETLRDAGVRVELDIKLRGAKASLRHADRAGIPVVALLGQRERESGQVLLRRMASRQESAIPLDDLVTAVQAAVQPSQPS
jgi:histidyl-tRNA synthetase